MRKAIGIGTLLLIMVTVGAAYGQTVAAPGPSDIETLLWKALEKTISSGPNIVAYVIAIIVTFNRIIVMPIQRMVAALKKPFESEGWEKFKQHDFAHVREETIRLLENIDVMADALSKMAGRGEYKLDKVEDEMKNMSEAVLEMGAKLDHLIIQHQKKGTERHVESE